MINIKISKRENGSISGVVCQGHANAQVAEAAYTLMQACGKQLEVIKAGKIEINDKEMCYISGMKQSKPAVAVIDTLSNGLEYIERKYPFCVQIRYLWDE